MVTIRIERNRVEETVGCVSQATIAEVVSVSAETVDDVLEATRQALDDLDARRLIVVSGEGAHAALARL